MATAEKAVMDFIERRPVSVKIGRFGPVVQIGLPTDEEKPLFANLGTGQSIDTITLEEALELFGLPRELGELDGEKVRANTGRFGPYVQAGKLFVSIPAEEDPYTISLERAVELIRLKREAMEKSLLRKFEEDENLEVRSGRWGPYICFKGSNYKIAKKDHERAAELTYEECMKIIEAEPKKPVKARRKK